MLERALRSGEELGRLFDKLGWRRVIAFHTNRPMQAAQEIYLYLLAKGYIGPPN